MDGMLKEVTAHNRRRSFWAAALGSPDACGAEPIGIAERDDYRRRRSLDYRQSPALACDRQLLVFASDRHRLGESGRVAC